MLDRYVAQVRLLLSTLQEFAGDHASDVSESTGTAWMDVGNECWLETLLGTRGFSLRQMPALIEAPQPSGFVRCDLLAE